MLLHPDHRRRKVQLRQKTLRDKSDLKSAADFFANLSEVIGQCSFLRFLLKRRLETGYRIVLIGVDGAMSTVVNSDQIHHGK